MEDNGFLNGLNGTLNNIGAELMLFEARFSPFSVCVVWITLGCSG